MLFNAYMTAWLTQTYVSLVATVNNESFTLPNKLFVLISCVYMAEPEWKISSSPYLKSSVYYSHKVNKGNKIIM